MNRTWTLLLISLVVAAPQEGLARKRRPSNHVRASSAAGARDLVPGAVRKPEGFRIRAPFPCGVPLRVNCAYGPSCSPAHKGVDRTSGPNDRYAIDFSRLAPDNGYDRAVTAVAPGVVLQAGWAKGGWAPYGKIVYIQHNYRDGEGHTYQTLYAHLNQVKVRKGDRVRAGLVIGTLGGSSRRKLGRLGPHLHFAMYQDARPTLGGGRAVFPEPLGRFFDLHSGLQFVSCGKPEPDRLVMLPPGGPIAVGGFLETDEQP